MQSTGETVVPKKADLALDKESRVIGPEEDPQRRSWDSSSSQGIWITNPLQAEKLRTLTGLEPVKDKVVNDLKIESLNIAPVRKATKSPILAIVGGVAFMVLSVVLGHECFQALAYSNHLNAGMKAIDAGNYDQAQVEFSLCINASPKASDAYYYRGFAELKRGAEAAAVSDYQKALQLNPGNTKALLASAMLSVKANNYVAALETLSKLVAADPSFSEAYEMRADIYNHLGRYNDAIEAAATFLGQYQSRDGHRADALAKKAFANDSLKKYDEAILDYSEAISCDPQNASLYASRAIVYKQDKQWKNAIADCNQAISLNPQDPVLYKVRGLCYARLRQSDSSLSDLDQLVKLYPTVETHRIRGEARLNQHDYLGSLEDFDYVLSGDPQDRSAHFKYRKAKANLQMTAKRTDVVADAEARAKMPSTKELLKPESVLVQNGYSLVISGDYEPAIAYLQAALRANPNNANAHRYLAYAFVQAGMPQMALSQFTCLGALQPFASADKLMLANAYSACSLTNKAVELYNEVLAREPKNDSARTNLIRALLNSGSTKEAEKVAAEGERVLPSLQAKYSHLRQQALASKKNTVI